MMRLHFHLSSEFSGAIAKRLPHAKNQHSVPISFFNQFGKDIVYIYIIASLPSEFELKLRSRFRGRDDIYIRNQCETLNLHSTIICAKAT